MKTKILIPLAGLALFCACKGKTGFEVVNNSSADSVQKDSAVTGFPKLVKTAAINFKVRNVQQTATRITALTGNFGGMVVHQQINSVPERTQDVRESKDSILRIIALNTTAVISVKIPSLKLEKFMDSVASMGIYVTDRSVNITDKSLDYLSATLKLKSRRELIEQQKKGKVIIKSPADVLNLKDDMIDQQIDNRQIDGAVKNSAVTLSIYQSTTINKEVVANDDPSAYNLPFFTRMGMSIENGWEKFIDVIVALANLWVLMPFGLGTWVIVSYYKKKKRVNLIKQL